MSYNYILVAFSCLVFWTIAVSSLNEAIWILSTDNGTRAEENRRLVGYTFQTVPAKILSQCALRCAEDARCHSYNFNKQLGSCQLNEANISAGGVNESSLMTAVGYIYQERVDFTVEKAIIGACASAPCQNGGKCIQYPTEKTAYRCLCKSVWQGAHCDVEVGHAKWTEWSVFGQCSATCGKSYKRRSRKCVDKLTGSELSADDCAGEMRQVQTCLPRPCPRWSDWGDWSECSTHRTCGMGRRSRTRTCDHGGKAGVDRLCMGPTAETETCTEINCEVPLRLADGDRYGEGRVEVLVDEAANLWGQMCIEGWDLQDASIACLQMGFAGAAGVLSYPHTDAAAPASSDQQCTGSESTLASCRHAGWFHDQVCANGGSAGARCTVDGGWSRWSEWGKCSVTCAHGIRLRTRVCNSPQPLNGGKNCSEESVQSKPCTEIPCPVDGIWDKWTIWSACSLSCGNGTRSRSRSCIGPFHNGAHCTGADSEEELCSTHHCPIDGVWLAWSEWDKCSKSCGGGNQTRDRKCAGPFYGGLDCVGDYSHTQDCNTHHCPVDGVWEMWSVWTECSMTCGGGHQNRSRTCTDPFYGGNNCIGEWDQVQTCNNHNCPIDGHWKDWSAWGECSFTCGGGQQSRHRECNFAKYGGDNCTGNSIENRTCNELECPVDGVWLMWSPWSNCSASCGGGNKTRARECDGPYYNGRDCAGKSLDVAACNIFYCPVNGVWLEWSTWNQCNVTCGGGSRMRKRSCDGPFYGGMSCNGDSVEIDDCNTQNCPVNGDWRQWSSWSVCTLTCGNGTRERTRQCQYGLYGGQNCTGASIETEECNTQECPVDGYWEAWTDWGACSVTCGGGSQTRNRTCHEPQYGGRHCNGSALQNQTCNNRECPVDGFWNPWTKWGMCNVSCGGGMQNRSRTCTPPLFGGKHCTGNDTEFQWCNAHNCPVDGFWSVWFWWGSCSVSCGGGIQNRSRECIMPRYGGENCTGNTTDYQTCNTQHCPVNGLWNEWSQWQACNVTCGGGLKMRNRTCVETLHGGTPCEGLSTQHRFCGDNPCPVHGAWSDWTRWFECNKSCGGGIRRRYRICSEALFGGKNCSGNNQEFFVCNNFSCPIDGNWAVWELWSSCSHTCSKGTRMRTRTCEGPYFGGKNCTGESEQKEGCYVRPCPVHGVWSAWMKWSDCSITCGNGTRTRSRFCEGPYHGGLNCTGKETETESCFLRYCPVDGFWGIWSNWSSCSETCGNGTEYRFRICTKPQYGGLNCSGSSSESRVCFDRHCPVDGIWSTWSDWSLCSKTCGNGTRYRLRTCTEPLYGGLYCNGSNNDSTPCFERHCPIDGFWGIWSNWSSCSETCGNGTEYRFRICTKPQYGGLNCSGSSSESRVCFDRHCPVDGIWSTWSDWSLCSKTCGNGTRYRLRTCTEPRYGGLYCYGSNNDSTSCFERHCPIDGVWNAWSQWSGCSLTCGTGTRRRNRACDGPYYNGLECAGNAEAVDECNENLCPIPGLWFPWSAWSVCTRTCGGGNATRHRECDWDSFENLTDPCPGPAKQIKTCHAFPCTPRALSCYDWKLRGLSISTQADISPQQTSSTEYRVECDIDDNDAWTIVGHDVSEKLHVSGYEGSGEFSRRVNYLDLDSKSIPVSVLSALVNGSLYCEQYARWECKESLIHNQNSEIVTYFENRWSTPMNYFPGADVGSGMCACGKDNTCANEEPRCNCDNNDAVWREDSGNFTNLADLPITGMSAGDTGRKEEAGYFTLGNLRCSGKTK